MHRDKYMFDVNGTAFKKRSTMFECVMEQDDFIYFAVIPESELESVVIAK